MIFSSAVTARKRLLNYRPVYCLFTDLNGERRRWQLACVTVLRKRKGYLRLLNVQGREAIIPALPGLFDDGSR